MFIVCNIVKPISAMPRPCSPYWAGEADAPNDICARIGRFAQSTFCRVSLPTWVVATGATVAFVFLASNPVGWMATAIGVTILCAKVIMIIVAPLLVTSAATYTANFIIDSNKIYRKNSEPSLVGPAEDEEEVVNEVIDIDSNKIYGKNSEPSRVRPAEEEEVKVVKEVIDTEPLSRTQTPFEAREYHTPSIRNSEDSDE